MQHLLKEALARLDDSGKPGAYAKQLLDLRFFQRKSLDYIADQLGLSRTTHYRHEQEALGMLERAIIELVVPAVRLSIPTQPARFVGRTQLIESCLAELKQLRTINLVGPPGIGKSSLAAVLASRWGREQVFWYSLQPGFNDQLMSLMHALGYFLFRLGHPALWLQLIASRGNSDAEVCAAIVRHELSDLDRKPLVCIDNADVLLPFEDKQHTQLLSFLGSLHEITPVLIIGQLNQQRGLIKVDAQRTLSGLTSHEAARFVERAGLELDSQEFDLLIHYTHANPLLMDIFVALRRLGDTTAQALAHLSAAPSIPPFVERILERLEAPHRAFIAQLSVFRGFVPADIRGELDVAMLVDFNLIKQDQIGSVELLPVLKRSIYNQLAPDERRELHWQAAQFLAARAQYTEAIYHCIKCGRDSTAIRIWASNKQNEIDQGKAGDAAMLLREINPANLPPWEREALHIGLGELQAWLGRFEQARRHLANVTAGPPSASSVLALQRQAEISLQTGELDRATSELTEALRVADVVLGTAVVNLHRNAATALIRRSDFLAAWKQTLVAQCELLATQGFIQLELGRYAYARQLLDEALRLAQEEKLAANIARIQGARGELFHVMGEYEAAIEEHRAALDYYLRSGNFERSLRIKSALAGTYCAAGQPKLAIPLAQEALEAYRRLGVKQQIAFQMETLAGAYFDLGELDQAERWARQALETNETRVMPYALNTLAGIHLARGEFDATLRACGQGIEIANHLGDERIAAYLLEAMSQAYRQTGKQDLADLRLEESRALFDKLGLKH